MARRRLTGQMQRPGFPPEAVELYLEPLANNLQLSWPFDSPAGSSGTFYFGGYYLWHSASFVPAGGTVIGTANASYAAHVSIVTASLTDDMVVSVTGTSINDFGTRTTSDVEVLDTSQNVANSYFETSKKFLGEVTIALDSGTGVSINAGYSKYWDYANNAFRVTGCEAVWLGGAADTGANIELLRHTNTGWTYGAGGAPTTPTPIAAMVTDHVTEVAIVNGEDGAWKRANLSQNVAGNGSEGILWRITTTSNKTFELGSLILKYEDI